MSTRVSCNGKEDDKDDERKREMESELIVYGRVIAIIKLKF